MATKKMKDLLNRAIAREMQVSIQYMWQHILWKGVEGYVVKDQLRAIAIVEMRHAELVAERLAYFGGTPTVKPDPIFIGKTFKQMMKQDVKDEQVAIDLYKQIIEQAEKENDPTTKKLFETILAEEEDHLDMFRGLLGK
jgi:bacterioferritin